MPQIKGKFNFSLSELESHKDLFVDDKVCVISIIGKSDYKSNNCKAHLIENILEGHVFQTPTKTEESEETDKQNELMERIEGYYDTKDNIIYLHLIGVLDSNNFIKTCQLLSSQLENKGFLHSWADMKYCQAKALLFLFSITHIILIMHPNATFDVGYVHLFRTIDGIRQKIQPRLTEILKERTCVSEDWAVAGRPCSPRALFIFNVPHQDSEDDQRIPFGSRSSKTVPKLPRPIKKLEHALEDQIYRILRKSRVITNISMNSLFAIPANQEFVFVQTPDLQPSDSISFLLHQLQEKCLMSLDLKLPSDELKHESASIFNNGTMDSFSSSIINKELSHNFKDFLWEHVNLAHNKGFDDNVGRHAGSSVFELPTAKIWYQVASLMYELLFEEKDESDSLGIQEALNSLRNQIDVDGRFSEARCFKVLPLAISTYQEGLPTHYSSAAHESQLTQASRMFAFHGRGPAFEKFALQLQEECEKFWKNGHQLCEFLSLTGNPCLKPIHKLPGEVEEEAVDGSRTVPGNNHSSQIKFTAACNCGRKQGSRDDPFDAKTANYEFYKQLEKICCKDLEHYEFPVFQPSTPDFQAAKINVKDWSLAPITPNKRDSQNLNKDDRDFLVAPTMSLALSLGQSLGAVSGEISESKLSLQGDPSPRDGARSEGILSVSDIIANSCASSSSSEKEEKVMIRQASTTEYLPGMLHSESPSGLLPSFPSWSLICLGPSSLYSHNIGIQDQPGFISSTNFLLPWDVTVKTGKKDKWPTIAETSGRKGHTVKGKKSTRAATEFSVKIFIGAEYECPRGHRFMCSAPDKILKASGSGLVKENASKVTSNDMPLYFPCPCRSGKSTIAQLMRIHVVTPKAPVHVTLDPKVIPSSNAGTIFHPGNPDAIKLSQSTYWILRLPFIYEGNSGSFIPTKDKKNTTQGRLLKGTYNVVQVDHDEMFCELVFPK